MHVFVACSLDDDDSSNGDDSSNDDDDGGSFLPASVMLVGDPDQLPPVGPGQPVADALAEGLLPHIDLRQIYRTAASSKIVTSAHAINRGRCLECIMHVLNRACRQA